ncbi:Oleate-activated transcription factor 1 [Cytospora mali]|uniref:Oleate-activated transcription factor 1 n=1 Tax=Cytospora mali TaxID=578113 RepID=A0A194VF27_CYTMA|nr:Oleate-activated transcription factor 1 [Valsa mali var. pyri (nom. inval.)]
MDRNHRKRVSAPRKKACHACTVAKTRCDLIRPNCSRCLDRQLQCEYSVPALPGPRAARQRHVVSPIATAPPPAVVAASFEGPSIEGAAYVPVIDQNLNPSYLENQSAVFNKDKALLLTPLDVSRIRDRWLDYYFTPTQKQIKPYTARTMALISRTLFSYPGMWLRNQSHIPPFIHPAQCANRSGGGPESLANCLSLLRLCDAAAPGSGQLVRDSVQREMSRLASDIEKSTLSQGLDDHLHALSALQAYLLLSIHAYSSCKTRTRLEIFSPGLITSLHDLAARVSTAGIVCPEEVVGQSPAAVPAWESWIIAEAKRRTVYCVYLFEDLYNHEHDADSYLGEELGLLLAPASKWVWQAKSKESFAVEFSDWTKTWGGGRGLVISEFWPKAAEDMVGDLAAEEWQGKREERIMRYSETVDEFGMFLLAICTATFA